MFAAVDLLSHSSYDPDKYKRALYKARLIRSSILSAGQFPDACSRVLSIALYHKVIAPIRAVTSAIFQKKKANTITWHEKKEKKCSMQHQSVIN